MKRHKVDPGNFSLLTSLDEFARRNGGSINEESTHEQLIESLRLALEEHVNHKARIHGFRAQAMFAHVVAAMGSCALITEEDSGAFFDTGENLKRPDFRLITSDGKKMLVEVKNFHPNSAFKEYRLDGGYVTSLQRYAELNSIPLKIAIYWSRWNIWTLLDPRQINTDETKIRISLANALSHNEMYLLGDCIIGTAPPLSFRIHADREKPRKVVYGGESRFAIKRVCLCSAGMDIIDPVERRIAWFLILNGNWHETEEHLEIEDDLVEYYELRFRPGEQPEEMSSQVPFQSVGYLSQMVTTHYLRATTETGNVARLTPSAGPDKMGIVIPEDYQGQALRLWRLVLLPKHVNLDSAACP